MKREFEKRDIKSAPSILEGSEKKTIVGFIPYNSRSVNMGFIEVILPSAFTKTLADGADVKAFVNHDDNKLLGRVKNGSLRLESREDGLYIECDLPETSYANDVYTLIKDGYCTTMSFGFVAIQDEIDYEDGKQIRYLKEAKLGEVSFGVPFPAYEGTISVARSVRGLDLQKLGESLAKEELENSDFDEIKGAINILTDLLPKEPEQPAAEPESTEAVEEDTSAADEQEQLLQKIYDELQTLKRK